MAHKHGPDCNHGPKNDLIGWIMYVIKNINNIVWDAAKYFFYVLVAYLMPMCSYRFFF